MYELLKTDGLAKRGRLHTVHGVIETPVFMNVGDRKSTRLNSSHLVISYAVFCLKKKSSCKTGR